MYPWLHHLRARTKVIWLLLCIISSNMFITQHKNQWPKENCIQQSDVVFMYSITSNNKLRWVILIRLPWNTEHSLTEQEVISSIAEQPTETPYSRARYTHKNCVCIKSSNVYLSCMLTINSRFIIENKQISHNQELGVFTVLGTTGRPHAIRIFPKESCTCPSTGRCYHILAVKMSIGLEDIDSRRKVNLTQLRRNTRSRGQKKSGRKAPRPGDYEIVPAPDASISEVRFWLWSWIYETVIGRGISTEVLRSHVVDNEPCTKEYESF